MTVTYALTLLLIASAMVRMEGFVLKAATVQQCRISTIR
jgi:hypothetical protein